MAHGAPSGGRRTATFDTRVDKVRHLPGSADRKAGKLLHRLGYASVLAPESFYVADTDGPLLDGELARATAWGALLARSFPVDSGATPPTR